MKRFRHFVLVGSTASGKSSIATEMARGNPELEIVSADSMQVYRGMDIGTAKPTPKEREEVRHHVIDVVEPTEDFSVVAYQQAANEAIADIESRGKTAIVVGGTGLYVHALVNGLAPPRSYPQIRNELENDLDTDKLFRELAACDPNAAANMQPNNRRRIIRALEVVRGSGEKFSDAGDGVAVFGDSPYRLIGIWWSREKLAERIEQRYAQQMSDGFIEEVKALSELPLSRTARQALGYRELLAHINGEISLDDAVQIAIKRTKSFARRQRMWFRRDPRIAWVGVNDKIDSLAPSFAREWQAWLN